MIDDELAALEDEIRVERGLHATATNKLQQDESIDPELISPIKVLNYILFNRERIFPFFALQKGLLTFGVTTTQRVEGNHRTVKAGLKR